MKAIRLKVARIGNSRGVRIPAATLARYRIDTGLVMEERSEGILLRPLRSPLAKLSWEETADAMAGTAEDWSEWNAADNDGMRDIIWQKRVQAGVSEPTTAYNKKRRARPRRKRG
jgi:antitoxin component of MazEF toxin-antitoxin module